MLTVVSLASPRFQLVHRFAGDHDGKTPRRRGRLKTMPPASTGDQTLGTLTRWGFDVPRGGGATSRVGVPNRRGGVQPPRCLVGSRGKRSPRRITETVQRVSSAPLGTNPSPRDRRKKPHWLEDARLDLRDNRSKSPEGFSILTLRRNPSGWTPKIKILRENGNRITWLWQDKVKGLLSLRDRSRDSEVHLEKFVNWRLRNCFAVGHVIPAGVAHPKTVVNGAERWWPCFPKAVKSGSWCLAATGDFKCTDYRRRTTFW